MNNFTKKLDYFIDQFDIEKQVFHLGKDITNRGWLNKKEFLAICLWKSRRPKRWYLLNTEEFIIEKTRLALSEEDEIKKINHLTQLQGVKIPTASAILSVCDPHSYPIIDERCVQSLKDLEVIDWEIITEKSWVEYLEIIRELAQTHHKKAREIEKGLFAYNRLKLDKEFKNLYKSV